MHAFRHSPCGEENQYQDIKAGKAAGVVMVPPTALANQRAKERAEKEGLDDDGWNAAETADGSADDEADEDDTALRPRTGAAPPGANGRRVKQARPSSAFRGASPREAPPEDFKPDLVALNSVMRVTSDAKQRTLTNIEHTQETQEVERLQARECIKTILGA